MRYAAPSSVGKDGFISARDSASASREPYSSQRSDVTPEGSSSLLMSRSWESNQHAPESCNNQEMRSGGCEGSHGITTPPALSTARNVMTASGPPRSNNVATTPSGPTP